MLEQEPAWPGLVAGSDWRRYRSFADLSDNLVWLPSQLSQGELLLLERRALFLQPQEYPQSFRGDSVLYGIEMDDAGHWQPGPVRRIGFPQRDEEAVLRFLATEHPLADDALMRDLVSGGRTDIGILIGMWDRLGGEHYRALHELAVYYENNHVSSGPKDHWSALDSLFADDAMGRYAGPDLATLVIELGARCPSYEASYGMAMLLARCGGPQAQA